MISDTTLETVLDLWKRDKITLEEVKKLLNIEGEGVKWKQPQDLQPIIPWIQPYNPIPIWYNQPWHHPDYTITCTPIDKPLTIDYITHQILA